MAVFLLLALTATVSAVSCPSPAPSVPALTRFELEVDGVTFSGKNPFNYTQAQLTATFTHGASGASSTIDAFYMPASEKAKASWRLRFAPTVAGSYSFSVLPHGASISMSGGGLHNCTLHATAAGDSRGYLRASDNGRHFRFDNGSSWMGVGENVAWASNLTMFKQYFTRMSAAGGNYARLWLTDSWDPLYLNPVLGAIDGTAAANLDAVVAMAEALDIRLMFCLDSFNQFCNNTFMPCSWSQSPWNAANGGPLTQPQLVWTNEAAIALWKQRLRYVASRWGYSTHLYAYELWNEVDLTNYFDDNKFATWAKTMVAQLHEADPNKHMVSVSFSFTDPSVVYSMEDLAFTMTHSYGGHDAFNMLDDTSFFNTRKHKEYGKPTYLAEFGIQNSVNSSQEDPDGFGLHNGLWAGIMSGGAATSMTWWWDSWVAADDLYSLFTAPALFAASVDWVALNWTAAALPKASNRYGWAMTGQPHAQSAAKPMAVAYLMSQNATWLAHNHSMPLNALHALDVSLTLPDGAYSAEWWNTTTGAVVRTDAVSASGGSLHVKAPTFWQSIALLVRGK